MFSPRRCRRRSSTRGARHDDRIAIPIGFAPMKTATRRGDRTEMTFTPLQRGLSLAAVIAASFGVGLSFGVGFPLTSLTFEAWRQPKWMIGLAGALPADCGARRASHSAQLRCAIGPVTAIAGGCLEGESGSLPSTPSNHPGPGSPSVLLMSAGFALPWLAGETWINTVSREETRGRVIAIYAIAFFAGFSTGPYHPANASDLRALAVSRRRGRNGGRRRSDPSCATAGARVLP